MKSYIELNDELDNSLTVIENIENKLVDLLIPIYKSIDKYPGILSPVLPKNMSAISIRNIKIRLMILKEDIKITSRIDNEEKNRIINIIDSVIPQLFLIDENEKDIATRKIIELRIAINKRKEYVEKKYNTLKEIDLKLNNNDNNDDYLINKRKEIILDSDLCEDIKILYDYNIKISKENNLDKEKKQMNEVNNVDDLYKLVDIIIRNQISEVLKYRFLSKKKIRELKYKLRLCVSNYVSNYIIMNNSDLTSEIEEFSIILKSLIKGELENNFEMKDKLGSEYINSNDDKKRIITIKEVIENEDNLFEMNYVNKFETILELSQVDENNIKKVREFVIKMGPEFVPIFDNLWIQPDIKRRKKFLENHKLNKEKQIEILKSIDY